MRLPVNNSKANCPGPQSVHLSLLLLLPYSNPLPLSGANSTLITATPSGRVQFGGTFSLFWLLPHCSIFATGAKSLEACYVESKKVASGSRRVSGGELWGGGGGINLGEEECVGLDYANMALLFCPYLGLLPPVKCRMLEWAGLGWAGLCALSTYLYFPFTPRNATPTCATEPPPSSTCLSPASYLSLTSEKFQPQIVLSTLPIQNPLSLSLSLSLSCSATVKITLHFISL